MLKFTIVTLLTVAFLAGSVALATGLSHPVVAVNRIIGVPSPGQPAPTEPNTNTVVVATVQPAAPTVTKTILESKTLTCIDLCKRGLSVVLNTIIWLAE
ncbi:MAG: hypothetical protein JO202_14655 [Ktedonobacteraceae bacterium]|nr:hypothetical protein [Ktedonobacteraceae bacterium]